MTISFQQAYLQLTDPNITHTVDSLFQLLDDVTGSVLDAGPDSTHFLFSGGMPNGLHSGEIVGEILGKLLSKTVDCLKNNSSVPFLDFFQKKGDKNGL